MAKCLMCNKQYKSEKDKEYDACPVCWELMKNAKVIFEMKPDQALRKIDPEKFNGDEWAFYSKKGAPPKFGKTIIEVIKTKG